MVKQPRHANAPGGGPGRARKRNDNIESVCFQVYHNQSPSVNLVPEGYDYPPLPFEPPDMPPYLLRVRAGHVAWAIEDSFWTFLAELRARDVLNDADPRVTQALNASWLRMCMASYSPRRLQKWAGAFWQRFIESIEEGLS